MEFLIAHLGKEDKKSMQILLLQQIMVSKLSHNLMTLDLCSVPILQGKPRKENRKLCSACKTMISPAQIPAPKENQDRGNKGPRRPHQCEVSCQQYLFSSLCSSLFLYYLYFLHSSSLLFLFIFFFSFSHRLVTSLNTSVQIFNTLLYSKSIFKFGQSSTHFKSRRFQKVVEVTKHQDLSTDLTFETKNCSPSNSDIYLKRKILSHQSKPSKRKIFLLSIKYSSYQYLLVI